MNAGWIDAVCAVETADAPLLGDLLERHLRGTEATCCGERERLGVEFPTDEDEALFRLHLLRDGTIGDICRVADRCCLVSPRLSDDVRGLIERGAFEAAVRPLTIIGLELNGRGVFRRLEGAPLAADESFSGQPPLLWAV